MRPRSSTELKGCRSLAAAGVVVPQARAQRGPRPSRSRPRPTRFAGATANLTDGRPTPKVSRLVQARTTTPCPFLEKVRRTRLYYLRKKYGNAPCRIVLQQFRRPTRRKVATFRALICRCAPAGQAGPRLKEMDAPGSGRRAFKAPRQSTRTRRPKAAGHPHAAAGESARRLPIATGFRPGARVSTREFKAEHEFPSLPRRWVQKDLRDLTARGRGLHAERLPSTARYWFGAMPGRSVLHADDEGAEEGPREDPGPACRRPQLLPARWSSTRA